MQEYHYEIKAKAGAQNGHANALSRKKEDEGLNSEQILIQVINSVKLVFDKREVLLTFHDHMSAGHFGVWKTYNKLSD